MQVRQRESATRPSSAPFVPQDFARDVAPLVAASAVTAAGIATLRRSKPNLALRAARFVNLLLVSLMVGNGVGGERFVQAPLRKLRPKQFLEAEQAITRSYLPMVAVMPASVLSGVLVLSFMSPRRGASFWLTAAGTVSMLGVLATTIKELPLNRETLTTSPESPDTWLEHRSTWERFNHLRTGLEITGWSCLSLAALLDEQS